MAPPLATKVAESNLQQRVESLKEQLRYAEDALEQLRKGDVIRTDKNEDSDYQIETINACGDTDADLVHRKKILAPPPGKSGYLFKWQDRSIGWGGTKWALRFVKLEKGNVCYYSTHNDIEAPRCVLSLRGCAVRDDGWKRNRRHSSNSTAGGADPPLDETGAYFFIFSIYQRQDDESDDVVPLLRFSTPSLAEKNQWVQLISESCEYCDTDAYLDNEISRAAELDRQEIQQLRMAKAMPEAKEGTLPPVYFANPVLPAHPSSLALKRTPSFTNKLPGSKKFKTKSTSVDAEKVESRSIKGYAPSRPMHRRAEPSYLSSDAPIQNYRGMLNLFFIMLVLSNFRLLLATFQRHGFVLGDIFGEMKRGAYLSSENPWTETPFVAGFLLQLFFTIAAFGIEWLLSRKLIVSEGIGMILHHTNAHLALIVPMWIVWNYIDNPVIGSIVLLHASITWMKLISYFSANQDYRHSSFGDGPASHKATLALVENLDLEDVNIVYPQNITLSNLMYFWLAPTLTYQIAFPKYPFIRIQKILGIMIRMVGALVLFAFLATQTVTPTLESLVNHLEETCGKYTFGVFAEHYLRLSIANTYLWLIGFYFYFHLYLNLFAEILRFGDRVFYKDWWNSSDVSSYWRLWNAPVHYWLIRHVYFPCVRLKIPRTYATVIVFLLSAVMHEILVSVPFHMTRPWSFLGMMMQLPLVAVTKYLYKKYPGSSVGNIIFWVSFCIVGQPMAVLLYTIDYQYVKQISQGSSVCSAETQLPLLSKLPLMVFQALSNVFSTTHHNIGETEDL